MLARVVKAAAADTGMAILLHSRVTQPSSETDAPKIVLSPTKSQPASVISLDAEATFTIPSRALVLSEAVLSCTIPQPVPLQVQVTVTFCAALLIKTSNSESILKCTYSPASYSALALPEKNASEKTTLKTIIKNDQNEPRR